LTCAGDGVHPLGLGLIQIRDVLEDVHRTLKARAAATGTSLSDYVRREITRVARTPTPEEFDERIRAKQAPGSVLQLGVGARGKPGTRSK